MNSQANKRYRRVLTIAGSDSGGGAGIQADLKAIAANGCYGLSVITALTAQNTQGVFAIHSVPVDFVRRQLEVVLDDIGVDAVKIGMLFSVELIETIAEVLRLRNLSGIVLDPVMVATSGDKLLEDDAVSALKESLVPLADLITPNLPEAEALLGRQIDDVAGLEGAAEELSALGCANVLVKGAHLERASCTDVLYMARTNTLYSYPAERIATANTHGTGCTLSSAIAAKLASDMPINEAVEAAKEYITGAIRSGAEYRLGGGNGPVNHFYRFF
ncbi:MAG: bifunctional hydroxymethylpyrimidine kinase/phosphomethylpyrimidine kinase [Deltaproteobacteria bacterium]|nr:MAG: bifunctional hydroxymethylpyrimidine kinase/phosphomethylpyrimidine kinase [Deltaproteobacteria bacterium]